LRGAEIATAMNSKAILDNFIIPPDRAPAGLEADNGFTPRTAD